MKINSLTTILTALTLTAVACGRADDRKESEGDKPTDNPQQAPADEDSATLMADDEEVASQSVTAQVDSALESAGEEQTDASGAALADVTKDGEVKLFRECTEDGAKGVVDIRRSVTRTLTVEGAARKLETSLAGYQEKHRVWEKDGGAVKCAENKRHVALAPAELEGVKLTVDFKHGRSRETTFTNKVKNVTVSRSFKLDAEGQRVVTWKNVEEQGDVLVIEKEATTNAKRTLVLKNKKGEAKTLEGTLTTADGAPLAIKIERDKTSLAVKSWTLVSGKLVHTGKDGGRVETTFSGVKYTAEKKCVATEGKISGAIYAKDATEPKATFEITFDGDSKTVTLSNGKEFDYTPEGCELDEPAGATEAATKDAVTKPEGV